MTTPTIKHIVRIANVDIPGHKPVTISLTKILGVGKSLAHCACQVAGIPLSKKTGTLNEQEIQKLTDILTSPTQHLPLWMLNRRKDYDSGQDAHLLTGKLQFTFENDIKRLKKIKSLRGMRHQRKLPVRGQRTRSNFRRSKGKVVGVKKKGKK